MYHCLHHNNIHCLPSRWTSSSCGLARANWPAPLALPAHPTRSNPPGCSLHHNTAGNHPVTTTACSATIHRHPQALASSITHPATCASTSQPRNSGHQLCWSGLCSLLRLRGSPGSSTCIQGRRNCLRSAKPGPPQHWGLSWCLPCLSWVPSQANLAGCHQSRQLGHLRRPRILQCHQILPEFR
jgi:hypothetical protein